MYVRGHGTRGRCVSSQIKMFLRNSFTRVVAKLSSLCARRKKISPVGDCSFFSLSLSLSLFLPLFLYVELRVFVTQFVAIGNQIVTGESITLCVNGFDPRRIKGILYHSLHTDDSVMSDNTLRALHITGDYFKFLSAGFCA